VGAVVLAGCGLDTDVVSLDATRTPPSAPAPTTTVPATSPPSAPTTEPTVTPTTDAPPPTTTTSPSLVEPELYVDLELASVVDIDDRKPSRDHDPFVAAAYADIERWWS